MSGQPRPSDVGELAPPPVVTGPSAAVPPPPASPGRRALSALGLLSLLASAVFGANAFGVRERFLGSETPTPRAPAAGRVAGGGTDGPATTGAPAPESLLRSQPWWQRVGALEGVGRTTARALTIDPRAIQWRARWTCQTGHLSVRVPGRPRPVVDAACPGDGTAFATQAGTVPLEVAADGPWRLEVDQQVDLPLVEPPLPAMATARKVAVGSFYRIDQTGKGSLTLYELADGSHALRLEDFYTTPNVDLDIRFSALDAPRTTEEFMNAPASDKVAPLDVTTGSMNFTVPAGVDPMGYRSVVIWCPLIDSAYAAATLRPAT